MSGNESLSALSALAGQMLSNPNFIVHNNGIGGGFGPFDSFGFTRDDLGGYGGGGTPGNGPRLA